MSAAEPDLVIRATTSRETTGTLGVMHEARCKHCAWRIELDTFESCLSRGGAHLSKEHGITLMEMRRVALGQERWE